MNVLFLLRGRRTSYHSDTSRGENPLFLQSRSHDSYNATKNSATEMPRAL
jgi:hypothetical protein